MVLSDLSAVLEATVYNPSWLDLRRSGRQSHRPEHRMAMREWHDVSPACLSHLASGSSLPGSRRDGEVVRAGGEVVVEVGVEVEVVDG